MYERMTSAWGYQHTGNIESWFVIGHEVGTAGNMSVYRICRLSRNTETGEEELWPCEDEPVFNTLEEACEAYKCG